MLLYYTYDCRGFETAKTESLSGDPITLENIEQIIIDSNHDLIRGHCTSFQIYLENGELIFNSELKRAA